MVAWVHLDFVDHVRWQIHWRILCASQIEALTWERPRRREQHLLDGRLAVFGIGAQIAEAALEAWIWWDRPVYLGVDPTVQGLGVRRAPPVLQLLQGGPTRGFTRAAEPIDQFRS